MEEVDVSEMLPGFYVIFSSKRERRPNDLFLLFLLKRDCCSECTYYKIVKPFFLEFHYVFSKYTCTIGTRYCYNIYPFITNLFIYRYFIHVVYYRNMAIFAVLSSPSPSTDSEYVRSLSSSQKPTLLASPPASSFSTATYIGAESEGAD